MRLSLVCGLALAALTLSGLSSSALAAGRESHDPARVVYVALGASDTVGVGAANPARDNWAALLARRLPHGARYVNLGRSGITLAGALTRELPAALAAHPTVVTVWLAVNDLNAGVAPSLYAARLNMLLAALRQTHARVVVGNVPDLRLVPAYAMLDPVQVDAVARAQNAVIAAAVLRHGATLVDLYHASTALWGHPEYISRDGFHPSTRGYVVLADLFYRVMHAHGAL